MPARLIAYGFPRGKDVWIPEKNTRKYYHTSIAVQLPLFAVKKSEVGD